jgi:hypothetical protein
MTIKAGVLGKLKQFNSIRQKQVTLPVAKVRAVTSPLTVRDDLSLRTMVVSPDVYDRILSELMYRHTEFLDMILPDGTQYKFDQKPTFEQFQSMVSEFDKKSLLWGIYASTYETFGKQDITCPSCQDKWEDVITAEQIVSPDSFSIWDEDKPFTDYVFPIDIEPAGNSEISKFRFNVYVPSIKDHLGVLRLVSAEKMKDNFDKFGKILSSSEELSLITKSIEVFSSISEEPIATIEPVVTEALDPNKPVDPNDPKQPFALEDTPEKSPTVELEIIQGLFDVYQTINDYIPLNIVDDVAKRYDEKFKKYIPTFKKPIECRKCKNDFDFPVDIELALFRSFLRL